MECYQVSKAVSLQRSVCHADKLIQDHNVAMVHDEFVDNLLLNLNPLLEKYGGGGGQHTLTS